MPLRRNVGRGVGFATNDRVAVVAVQAWPPPVAAARWRCISLHKPQIHRCSAHPTTSMPPNPTECCDSGAAARRYCTRRGDRRGGCLDPNRRINNHSNGRATDRQNKVTAKERNATTGAMSATPESGVPSPAGLAASTPGAPLPRVDFSFCDRWIDQTGGGVGQSICWKRCWCDGFIDQGQL